MFRSVLVANRGEIALRIMRTAKRLGMRTIAVYSEADAGAPHVGFADEAWLIGPPPAAESYLVIDRLIDAAQKAGAECIHPGYGFLSENAAFARACAAARIPFVGPPAGAIRQMGHKGAAKSLMEQAGVPVVPGYHGDAQDDETLEKAAADIGYPVLIKAAAGGGGKGMRRVDDPARFAKELKAARREAKSAFADDTMLIEKFVSRPRHIEIQVFADGHGNAVHLFERECSIQRRHQKVIEEAPAPGMTETMRGQMGEAAVAAARAIDYRGAGTIEFIVDGSKGLKQAPFYFMEMNTRLQVEHPVTELITGLDLVEWQFRVAAGEPLPLGQADLSISGHAIEARLYAENPAKSFFPQTGTLRRLRFPAEGPHLRVDSGVREGQEISIFYDPMIAKIAVWDESRPQAAHRLESALRETRLAGVTTNLSFLAAIAEHPAFLAGDLNTGFIDAHAADLIPEQRPADNAVLAIAALFDLNERARRPAPPGDPFSPWNGTIPWRLNLPRCETLRFRDGGTERPVSVSHYADGPRLEIGGEEIVASCSEEPNGDLTVELNGARTTVHVVAEGNTITVLRHGHVHQLQRVRASAAAEELAGKAGDVLAPLPGKIVQVLAAAGDSAKAGTPLLVLEAMKMEHTLVAPGDGTIAEVTVGAGDQVEDGAVLVRFKTDGS